MTWIYQQFSFLGLAILLLTALPVFAQKNLKFLPLPTQISGVNEEYSGMSWSGNRLYLLPQYGNHKGTLLDGPFSIYSLHKDSIDRVIDGKDSALTRYTVISVKNLNKLPDSVKKFYQGFEAITFHEKEVFLTIETDDNYAYCFVIKGILDVLHNQIIIDPLNFSALKRHPSIFNAGFESLTYLPDQQQLLALFEFNGMAGGGTGYLINPTLKQQPRAVQVPFLPFRLTDIEATKRGRIFGINYYWEGDYHSYLDNILLENSKRELKKLLPEFADSLRTRSYARVVTKKRWGSRKWKEVTTFDGKYNNWEGLALYKNGALVITDANRSKKLFTKLAFLTF